MRLGPIRTIRPVKLKLDEQEIWRMGEIAVAGNFVALYGTCPFVAPIELVCPCDQARVMADMRSGGKSYVDLKCRADLYELTFREGDGQDFVRAMSSLTRPRPAIPRLVWDRQAGG